MNKIDDNLLADPWWRLNNLYFIKDKKGKKIKFRPNWAQYILYTTMHYLNCILKARQLGLTTFIQLFMLDRCLFNENQSAGVVAHTKDDAQAFFDDKIKFAYDHLPAEIKRTIKADNNTAKTLKFSNGSKVVVGTSLRSGTYQYVHVSEYGKLCAKYPDKAEEVRTGTLNTVAPGQMIFIESTAEGPFGDFYEMCNDSQKHTEMVEAGETQFTVMDYKFFFFPWWKHPDYVLDEPVKIPDALLLYFRTLEKDHGIKLEPRQKAWYAKKALEQKDLMKQEYPSTPPEAFERVTETMIYGKQLREARRSRRVTTLPIVKGLPVNTFWDLGRNDVNAIWFHQHVDAFHHFIYYYENRLQNLGHYVEKLRDFKDDFGWFYGSHYLPHDVEVTDISEKDNKSRKEVLQDAGLTGIKVVSKCRNTNDAIELVRAEFDTYKFDKEGCELGLKRLANYEWSYDTKRKTLLSTPAKTPGRNAADAIRQKAQGYRAARPGFKAQQTAQQGGQRAYKVKGRNVQSVFNPSLDHVV